MALETRTISTGLILGGYMLSANQKITPRQLQILMILHALGVGLIVLPRRVAGFADYNGWMIVLGLTVIALIVALLITSISRIFPSQSFIAYTGRVLTKPVAYLAGIGLLGKLLFSAGMELRIFSIITKQFLLRNTPSIVICAVMVALAAFLAGKGIETRARIAEILFFIVMIPLIALLILAFFDINLKNLLPVMDVKPRQVLEGSLRLGYIFSGLECLLLVHVFINRPKQMRRAVLSVIPWIGLLLFTITAVTLAKFGNDISGQEWSVIRMMDNLYLPGAFVERKESLVMSFWIVSVFLILGMILFYGGMLMKDMKSPARGGINIVVCAVIIFVLSCLPFSADRIFELLDWVYYTFGLFYLLVLPLVIIIVARLRKGVSE